MLSIEHIREHPNEVREALKTRGEDDSITEILELDTAIRSAITERDNLNAERNRVSKELGQARSQGQGVSEEARVHMREIGNQADALNEKTKELGTRMSELMLTIPNLPQGDVPLGESDSDSVIIRQVGEPQIMDFEPKPHWDLGEELGIIDFERGTKLAGSRFYTMQGYGPKLERAVIAFMLDLHSTKHGYTEISLPAVVKRDIMEGSGNLPKFEDNLYHDVEDDLWLIPTAEVPITNLYRDEIIPANTLPIKYVAQTPCFRREKASAGRDTRGIKRVHQFNKVEMYQFVEPETSNDDLEKLVDDAEDVCRQLGFTYRVLALSTGDMGFASSKTYDIEVWAAGCQEWLEVSSCSNCTDFQARRSNIRYRAEGGGRPRIPHTLNGSGLALPRVIIAIMENNQQPDGSIIIPDVLRPYTGFDVIPAKAS
ncbi:MAG: serine--tRNA ligase [Chloroflexota bacterium]|jgi:seryl-tRNA synthetase|nr:serine--tRNA ligase [Dehalococcoidia bacterium]MEC9014502.1 serine--tRNA ligase [Chloroflexota bacterium]MED5208742.1 serine--tRNA ligase [Chloroflexota bacterium]MEE3013212.1 serine--tRNA ligase [Chloroflexota bacterium]GIS93526.1 MAG: serine--tRNA ligase [Dehalococcoidia bacterium]|tara:strand:+ start:3372 stop:4655 length:1284 start_codon:yes stop_codon:yes gene_type:complete